MIKDLIRVGETGPSVKMKEFSAVKYKDLYFAEFCEFFLIF